MLKQWIGALRLRASLLATLIAVASYRLCSVRVSVLPIAIVCVICMITMVQNDYRDRFHDVKKGKRLAFERPRQFLCVLLALWVLTTGLIAVAAWANPWTGVLLLAMAIVALVYSEIRSVPFLPAIVVSLTSASPALLPLTEGTSNQLSVVLFAAIAIGNYGREVFADIADSTIDRGYKHTIPSATRLRHPEKLAGVLLAIGAFLVPIVHPMGMMLAYATWPIGAAIVFVTKNPVSRKRWLCMDLATGLLIAAVIVR
ncbi:MAG: UbiA family prenyltransferase [Candidatus Kaiserbacteria bacterium]|nr:UbiA family prenyltransferase [Candidatus Kaiserbacteria bacterium]